MKDDIHFNFTVPGDDFTRAGEVSSNVKRNLKTLGVEPHIIRRAAIALYEGEINMAIHADGGEITVNITDDGIEMLLSDTGPGIADIDKAMQEGFSTASAEVRNLGFGAGMGLPNMKKNVDEMDIKSTVGVGTNIRMYIKLDE